VQETCLDPLCPCLNYRMGDKTPKDKTQAAPSVWTPDFGPSRLQSAEDIRFGLRSGKTFGQKQFDPS
jgi:hypothetical protein